MIKVNVSFYPKIINKVISFNIFLPVFIVKFLSWIGEKQQLNKKSMEELPNKYSVFFELDKPCPDDLNNCIELRSQYEKELEAYKAKNICTDCVKRSLRNKYITFLLATNKTNHDS